MANLRSENCKEKYEGSINLCKDMSHSYTIKEFISGSDLLIEFNNDSDLQMHKSVNQINKEIQYPWTTDKEGHRNPLYFEDNYKKYMGATFMTNEGYYVKVLEYNGVDSIVVQFTTEPYYTTTTTSQNLQKGQIRNPYKPNKFGGYIGEGPYRTKEYEWLNNIWYNMLIRANDPEYYAKYHNDYGYSNCYIDNDWLNYSNFAEWYLSELSKLNPDVKYEVDKDLLYRFYRMNTNNLKCYSSKTCLLLPYDLSNMIQSITNKLDTIDSPYTPNAINAKKQVKDCAEKYYKMNAISEYTYNIIMNG